MISQTAEYALRAIVALAQNPDAPMVTPDIAETTKVPLGYLAKVLQVLGRNGLVRSQRGLGGGFTLAREPGDITILEVVQAVDPVKRIEKCPLGLSSHGGRLCPLHARLDHAAGLVEQSFAETTVADLLHEPGRSAPLCNAEANST